MDKTLVKNNIKVLREKAGISQTELANEIYSTKQNISKYERGEVLPPVDVLMEIATYFDVTIDQLINYQLLSDKQTIKLDYNAYNTYYNHNILKESLSNIAIRNDVYISNIKRQLAVIDNYEDIPQIEFLQESDTLDSYEFTRVVMANYKKSLRSTAIHHTDSLLTVPELLKIISSLGANYDYFERPGSIKMVIEDEFIALVKLSTMLPVENGKIQLELNYSDLLLSQYYEYHDLTFTEEGYRKHTQVVSNLIRKRYNVEFDEDRIEPPMDVAHFLQYLIENDKTLPASLEVLYEDFNSRVKNLYTVIGKAFVKRFVEESLSKLLPKHFNIRVNYDFERPTLSLNGVINDFQVSARACNPASLVNFIITKKYEEINIAQIWKDKLDEYSSYLGVHNVERDILRLSLNSLVRRTDNTTFMRKYSDMIKTQWIYNKMRLLDLKSLKIIKSIVHKMLVAS